MKKINLILRKCKSLSKQLARSSSYSSLRSKSAKEDMLRGPEEEEEAQEDDDDNEEQKCETIYVGSTRKRYVISSKYLNHPLLSAVMDKSKPEDHAGSHGSTTGLVVNCEVVLFDHLLWMLENADPKLGSESMEELAELYVV